MKFFSYGIFILSGVGENRRYATVEGWKTVGHGIVCAVPDDTACLSGSIMDIDEAELNYLDQVEGANHQSPMYKRIEIETTGGQKAFMYVDGSLEVNNLAYIGGRGENERGINRSS